MTNTLVLTTKTTVERDGYGFYARTLYSVSMRNKLADLADVTKMHYVARMAYNRNKAIKKTVIWALNHENYDNFMVVIDNVNVLQNNVKNAFVAMKIACTQKHMRTYVYDNESCEALEIKPVNDGFEIRDRYHAKGIFYKEFEELIPDLYVRFNELKANANCTVQYEQLSKRCQELWQAVEKTIGGKVVIPRHYREYVARNANAYDISLPKTHYQTVDNIYHREGTERGARNTIGHCVGVTFNQVLDKEPSYVLNEQYLEAYLTIRYYQAIGFEPNPELYVRCPHCERQGRIEYIKRVTVDDTCCCKLCGTEVESIKLFDDIEKLF